MTGFDLTAEQEKIRAAYKRRRNLVINAYAGTGKTTMLRLLALADPYRQFLYVAYNKTAKLDAAATFPSNATCVTSHGLAFKPMIHMASRIQGSKKFVRGIELARLMKITAPVRLTPDKVLAPGQFASVVKATIKKFSYSADEKITRWHVPNDLRRFTDDQVAALRILVPPVAQRVWDEDITTDHGVVPMDHDYYLKAYQLKHPRLFKNPENAVIALDEAQDSNPCVAALILDQIQYGVQVIMVGDTYQQLYGWRGAEDAMTRFAEHPGVEVLSLTESFRFGTAIAGKGNELLTVLGAPAPLRGFAKIESRVGPIPGAGAVPDAELTRTNAEAFRLAIEYIGKGLKVSFPKGAGELIGLVKGAAQIKRGEPCEHPDLMAFATWAQVQDYVENEADGQDLKLFVDLVDQHGVDDLFGILRQIGNEDKDGQADVTISTVHSAKGRQWRLVRIARDFLEPKQGNSIPREMAMLLYVALTRAQYVLDCEAVAWISDYLGRPAGSDGDDMAAAAGRLAGPSAAEPEEQFNLASPAVARAMSLAQI